MTDQHPEDRLAEALQVESDAAAAMIAENEVSEKYDYAFSSAPPSKAVATALQALDLPGGRMTHTMALDGPDWFGRYFVTCSCGWHGHTAALSPETSIKSTFDAHLDSLGERPNDQT